MEISLNLCSIVEQEMRKLEFKDSSVKIIKANSLYLQAYDKKDALQVTMLTMMFYSILNHNTIIAPRNIRLALNISNGVSGWVDDLKLVILPFLKENESLFFS